MAGWVTLVVEDEGPGVSEAFRDRLFTDKPERPLMRRDRPGGCRPELTLGCVLDSHQRWRDQRWVQGTASTFKTTAGRGAGWVACGTSPTSSVLDARNVAGWAGGVAGAAEGGSAMRPGRCRGWGFPDARRLRSLTGSATAVSHRRGEALVDPRHQTLAQRVTLAVQNLVTPAEAVLMAGDAGYEVIDFMERYVGRIGWSVDDLDRLAALAGVSVERFLYPIPALDTSSEAVGTAERERMLVLREVIEDLVYATLKVSQLSLDDGAAEAARPVGEDSAGS